MAGRDWYQLPTLRNYDIERGTSPMKHFFLTLRALVVQELEGVDLLGLF